MRFMQILDRRKGASRLLAATGLVAMVSCSSPLHTKDEGAVQQSQRCCWPVSDAGDSQLVRLGDLNGDGKQETLLREWTFNTRRCWVGGAEGSRIFPWLISTNSSGFAARVYWSRPESPLVRHGSRFVDSLVHGGDCSHDRAYDLSKERFTFDEKRSIRLPGEKSLFLLLGELLELPFDTSYFRDDDWLWLYRNQEVGTSKGDGSVYRLLYKQRLEEGFFSVSNFVVLLRECSLHDLSDLFWKLPVLGSVRFNRVKMAVQSCLSGDQQCLSSFDCNVGERALARELIRAWNTPGLQGASPHAVREHFRDAVATDRGLEWVDGMWSLSDDELKTDFYPLLSIHGYLSLAFGALQRSQAPQP